MTIGSVQFNSHAGSYDYGARYMCVETGIGGGSVYPENQLFETEEHALTAAQLMADKANREMEWVVKLYNKTLELSDYQLEHALINQAKEYKSKIGSLFWNVSDLFEQIEGADDKDAILELVDDYKKYTWERDKAVFAEQGVAAGAVGAA